MEGDLQKKIQMEDNLNILTSFYLNGRQPNKNAILTNSAAQATWPTQQPKIYWYKWKNQP